jgi:chemotaxis protein methyltransferase WspC
MHERIAELLKRDLGLEAARLGHGSIERAVRERLAARKLTDMARYWTLLMDSAEERQQLIDAVVVPETWFFRDRGAFDALVGHTLAQWRASRPAGPMRLLSVPCSTGEEPYSMAMALLDLGVDAPAFQIDAADISERSLAVARAATYRRNSFRGEALEFRARHFDARGDAFALRPAVTSRVRLRRANLLDQGIAAGAPYDVVFCRNLLIYFERETQDRALQILAGLLSPAGTLFLGPSEAGLALVHRWRAIGAPLSFGFQRPAPEPPAAAPVTRGAAPRVAVRRPPPPLRREPVVAASAPLRPSADTLLSEARRLADEGCYDDARARCESFLQQHGPNAHVLFLLGLVRGAQGDAGAAAALYRKALYLDPVHEDTLVHYAMLLERRGDEAGARVLRERIRRRAAHAGEAPR